MRLLLGNLCSSYNNPLGFTVGEPRELQNTAGDKKTMQNYNISTQLWLSFCQKNSIDKFDFQLPNILRYLDYVKEDRRYSFNQLKTAKWFTTLCRRFQGNGLTESDKHVITKFMTAYIHQHPPCAAKAPLSWDVNIILDYFRKNGNTAEWNERELGGKLVLLMMLSTMARLGEIHQLQLSCMIFPSNTDVTFHLQKPTKTYGWNTVQHEGLQRLEFRTFHSCPTLCPVQTLQYYITKTKPIRHNCDKLFVLGGIHQGKPATQPTLARWCKDHFIEAGLGNFTIHSTRSSSSTSALLVGLSLNEVVQKSGWLSVDTFVRNQMRPQVVQKPWEKFEDIWRDNPNRVTLQSPRQDTRKKVKKFIHKFQRKKQPRQKTRWIPTPRKVLT